MKKFLIAILLIVGCKDSTESTPHPLVGSWDCQTIESTRSKAGFNDIVWITTTEDQLLTWTFNNNNTYTYIGILLPDSSTYEGQGTWSITNDNKLETKLTNSSIWDYTITNSELLLTKEEDGISVGTISEADSNWTELTVLKFVKQ